jgi:hypothetical protein
MLCNLWLITIILIIIIIIGLITFSTYKSSTEQFFVETIPTNSFSLLETANTIAYNNNQINRLLNQLENVNPNVQLINYNPNSVYLDMQDSITSNISTLNTNLISLNNKKITSNDNKINNLENTVLDLEKLVNNLGLSKLSNKKYNTIKSLNNGMEMNLISTPNTIFKDYKTGSNIAGYMVMANNGCLSVGASDYDIFQCNDRNSKQIFKMEHILNETAYQNNIDTSLPIDNVDKSSINYPFVMMKSINNENCLTNNHGNLTVQPCYSFVAQRWFPM